ncbi:MAG TPA: STAS domain-containing protein [Mycobacteriales bacterium]|nr:STAS domain-containing protein [Mycobacteriales bacterium]
MAVEARRFDRYVLVTAVGEFDVYSSPRLREVLANQPADIGLIVDLTGVSFLDSTVLGILVGAFKRARSDGGWVRLVCDNERILKVFRITGLVGVFEIWPTVEDAAREPG